jgi:hypothetical protein
MKGREGSDYHPGRSPDIIYALKFLEYQRTGNVPWRSRRHWIRHIQEQPPKPELLEKASRILAELE